MRAAQMRKSSKESERFPFAKIITELIKLSLVSETHSEGWKDI
jgi:hypothetical protein